MSRMKHPARSKPTNGQPRAPELAVKTGCARQQVAPATPNCAGEPEHWPQSRASQTARASVRTLDGESARRLSEPDPILTSNTVARAAAGGVRLSSLRCLYKCVRGNDRVLGHRRAGYPARLTGNQAVAPPRRRSLPGVALVQFPSSKVTSPLTMIAR